MSQAIIRSALETPLKNWAAAKVPAILVSWENVEFQQPQARYVRSNVLPLPTLSPDLGRLGRAYFGLYKIALCEPIGKGPGEAEAIVAELIALYPPAVDLFVSGVRVHVLTPLSPAPALIERDRYVIPCSLSYRADVYP